MGIAWRKYPAACAEFSENFIFIPCTKYDKNSHVYDKVFNSQIKSYTPFG
jgi:hypothetical protein